MTIASNNIATQGVVFGATNTIIRSMSRLAGRDADFDLWCNVSDFQNWQFGYERQGDQFNTREYWCGPLYLITNKL